MMKKYLYIFTFFSIFLILPFSVLSQTKEIKLNKSVENIIKINSDVKNIDIINIDLNLMDMKLTPIVTEKGGFVVLEVDGLTGNSDLGKPNIPIYTKLIEVPLEASINFEVISYNEEIIDMNTQGISHRIVPVQPSVSKSGEPVEFAYDEKVYNENAYFNTEVTGYEELGIMRSVRLGKIMVNPIQYNPVQNKLRVLNNLKIKVIFEGGDYQKTAALKSKYGTSKFDNLLQGYVLNLSRGVSTMSSNNRKETYVIVAHRMFEQELARFIAHKQRMGFNVIVAYTDQANVGSTTGDIKYYLRSLYENPPTGYLPPLYVLLVGDVDQVPSFRGRLTPHPTDLHFFEYTGDLIPEVFYGRFSANNVSELRPQIDKTINYELYTMPDPAYLSNALLMVGKDQIYTDLMNAQLNYAETEYINGSNGMTAYKYLQPEPAGGDYRGKIAIHLNNGMGFVNYTGHCIFEGLEDPVFRVEDIHSLNENNKYGLWIGNCCRSARFDEYECFAEAALRAPNKGAVGYIGASCNTQFLEDVYWSVGYGSSWESAVSGYNPEHPGVYDKMFHTHGEPDSEWITTQGQIIMAGNLSVTKYVSSHRIEYYWEGYHLLGDPSVKIRFAPSCNNDNINITETLSGGAHEYLSKKIINASNNIVNGANAYYSAKNGINILPGFNIQKGSSLTIDRRGCSE